MLRLHQRRLNSQGISRYITTRAYQKSQDMAASNTHFKLASTQTAIAIILPQQLQAETNSLRSIHDKAYKKWQPHINILYPFIDPSQLSSALPILRSILHNYASQSIQVTLDDVGIFKHKRNATIFLKPSSHSDNLICRLRKDLIEGLGCDEKEGTHDGVFRPHMTVGQAGFQGNGIEKLSEKIQKLAGLEWAMASLAVLKREVSGEMIVVEELKLGSEDEPTSEDNNQHLSDIPPWRPCYAFSTASGWQLNGETSPRVSFPQDSVSVLTYNIMAEKYAPPFKSRLPLITDAIASVIKHSDSLRILCLQEVNEEMLPLLLADPYVQKMFPFSSHFESSLLPSHRNLATFSSAPFQFHTLQFEERHKSALIISFCNSPIVVANVHLTSALTNDAVAIKGKQMEVVTKSLSCDQLGTKNVIVAGDFNLTSSSETIEDALSNHLITPVTAQLVPKVIDPEIWDDAYDKSEANTGLRNVQESATFDRSANTLAAISEIAIDDHPQRYDRVLYLKNGGLVAQGVQIIGLPNANGFCGSDHFGVCAKFKLPNSVRSRSLVSNFNVESILQPYLPSKDDEEQRLSAINLLHSTLSHNGSLSDMILAPLGSYCMETYFANSDVDMLAIGVVSPGTFFNFAVAQLQTLNEAFKGIHLVNSLVSIIEVNVIGIKFDIQYCQAPELLQRYHSTTPPRKLSELVFDSSLISALTPSSIRPLNTYRDTAYLLNTIPDLPSFRRVHRFLSLFLRNRGLYSAKFSYLGGVHLSLMLNHIIKHSHQSNTQSEHVSTPAEIIHSFFSYFSVFNWAQTSISDPTLKNGTLIRDPKFAIHIPSLHLPTARPNISASCTPLTAQLLTREFNLALKHISQNDFAWCLKPGIQDFLKEYGAYICVTLEIWDIDEMETGKPREIIGGLQSKFPRLLLALSYINEVSAQIWPVRLSAPKSSTIPSSKGEARYKEGKEDQLKGYYLIGISSQHSDLGKDEKKVFTGKVFSAVREFETMMRGSKEFQGKKNVWVGMEVLRRDKVIEMGLEVDMVE